MKVLEPKLDGIARDVNKSIYWFEKSAKQGNQGAQNTLC
jgi:TPR repeat protein